LGIFGLTVGISSKEKGRTILRLSVMSQKKKKKLGYVASSSDIPSTSKTVFFKPTVPEPPSVYLDKGKEVIGENILASAKATQKPPILRRPPICHHCELSGHIRL